MRILFNNWGRIAALKQPIRHIFHLRSCSHIKHEVMLKYSLFLQIGKLSHVWLPVTSHYLTTSLCTFIYRVDRRGQFAQI